MPDDSADSRHSEKLRDPALLAAAVFCAAALAGALVWRVSDPAVWLAAAGAAVLAAAGYRTLRRKSGAGRNMAALLDSDHDALLLEDSGGAVVMANGPMRALTPGVDGQAATAALEALLAEFNGEPATVLEALRASAQGGNADCRILCGSGANDPDYEISVQPLGDSGRLWRVHRIGGNPEAEFWPDRTERHATSSAAGFYSLDAAGRFTYVNPLMATWIGRSQQEIAGQGLAIHDILGEDSPDDSMKAGVGVLSIVGADGQLNDFQISTAAVMGPGGQEIHGVARPVGPAGSSAQRFQRLFHEIPVGVALVDLRLHIGDCNAPFRELVGDEDAMGKPVLDYVADSEKIAISSELQSILEGRSAAKSLEVRFREPDDSVASIFAGRLQDDEDRVAGLVLLAIDTTEQKNLEAQLAQSQKMQAVGQLAGGIAHDFNNVLTAMIGFCDLLLHRHRPGDQSFADIMQIKQNANRAAALVRQLLAFSRQQTLQPRLLNVTEVLAELSNLLRRLLGEKTELNMVHGRDLGLVKSDQGQLEQVIINLAVNARDAMEGGGRLTIETGNAQTAKPRQAHGETMPPGEYVQISVRDTGTGIPPENFARIFEPFFTTKEVGSGTGLGLSTVYGIVKQTGGYLFVDSPGEGQGTVFDIYFQRQQADTAAADRGVPDEIASDLTGGGTVLLVEDEDPVRLFSARALRNKGYKVIEAKTGEAALELLPGGEFDLLVTDMVMPRVDGSQVIREARKHLPDLPVICISGYTEDSVLKEVESIDNLRFLSKPFSLKQLAGAVKASIDDQERRRAAAGE